MIGLTPTGRATVLALRLNNEYIVEAWRTGLRGSGIHRNDSSLHCRELWGLLADAGLTQVKVQQAPAAGVGKRAAVLRDRATSVMIDTSCCTS